MPSKNLRSQGWLVMLAAAGYRLCSLDFSFRSSLSCWEDGSGGNQGAYEAAGFNQFSERLCGLTFERVDLEACTVEFHRWCHGMFCRPAAPAAIESKELKRPQRPPQRPGLVQQACHGKFMEMCQLRCSVVRCPKALIVMSASSRWRMIRDISLVPSLARLVLDRQDFCKNIRWIDEILHARKACPTVLFLGGLVA